MNSALLLSNFVFILTLITLVFAVAAYVVYKFDDRRKTYKLQSTTDKKFTTPVLLKKFQLPNTNTNTLSMPPIDQEKEITRLTNKNRPKEPIAIHALHWPRLHNQKQSKNVIRRSIMVIVILLVLITLGSISTDNIPCSWADTCTGEEITPVYLLESDYTEKYFTSVGGNYSKIIDKWHTFLQQQGIGYQSINDQQLEQGLTSPGLLILPGALALSAKQRRKIIDFHAQGGNLFVSWVNGIRDEQGKWLGLDFMQTSLNLDTHQFPLNQYAFIFSVGRTPISHSLPAGRRLSLGNIEDMLIRFGSQHNTAAHYRNWTRQAIFNDNDGAIIFQETEGARMVATGFPTINWNNDQQPMEQLMQDALGWLLHEAAVFKGDWPKHQQAALLFAEDSEYKFENAAAIAEIMQQNNYTGTFFSVVNNAKQYPEIVQSISRFHEIAYHGNHHVSFKGVAPEEQAQRLDNMINEMKSIIPAPIIGFRAPFEEYDENIERLLRSRGIEYVVANESASPSLLPFFSRFLPQTANESLLMITRTMRDDMNLMKEKPSYPEALNLMLNDFEVISQMGGLAIYSFHSQGYADSAEGRNILDQFLKTIKEKNHVWMTTGKAINDWWRNRNNVHIKLSHELFGTRLQLRVSAPGLSEPVDYILINPWSNRKPIVEPINGSPRPKTKLIDPYRTLLMLGKLEAGEYQYSVTF